jgi:phosphoenolpyruvate carboxykinase (ATP)
LKKDFDKKIDLSILNAGEFLADPKTETCTNGTSVNVNLKANELVVLGSSYAGEMKKGVFGVMHYYMPKRGVLSMHASANEGK